MGKVIKKEKMVNNSNQPQQKEKNIDFMMNEIKTFEILYSDVEIFNSKYLKKCLEKLECDEYHIERSIRTIKERISDLEHISQIEEEVRNNLSEIDDLYRFIENVCDTEEDTHEPYNRINDLMYTNEELNEEISEFYIDLNKN
jgi:hypothetical protein